MRSVRPVFYNRGMLIKLTEENGAEVAARALAVLERGGVIAYPTETFYALGARYDDEAALERLYELKHRPRDKAMPLLVGGDEQLALLTSGSSDAARVLMRRFWPGPLTLLFSARPGLSAFVVAGGAVAARVPGDSFALRLARAAPFAFTATSANRAGRPPAVSAAMVVAAFGDRLDLIVDGSETPGLLPSTIVDVAGRAVTVLREGAVPAAAVQACLAAADN